jgi:hypothetical protein
VGGLCLRRGRWTIALKRGRFEDKSLIELMNTTDPGLPERAAGEPGDTVKKLKSYAEPAENIDHLAD